MTQQKIFLALLPLFLFASNLFCLDRNEWAIDPSCPTIESKSKDSNSQVIIANGDCPTYSLDLSTKSDSYKLWEHKMIAANECIEAFPTFVCNTSFINNNDFEANLTDWLSSGPVALSSDAHSGSIAVSYTHLTLPTILLV